MDKGGVVNYRRQGMFTEWCEMNTSTMENMYGKNKSTFEKSKWKQYFQKNEIWFENQQKN